MRYKLLSPHPSLMSYLGCYWMLELDAHIQPSQQIIIPDGYSELIFNLGASYGWYLQDKTRTVPDEDVVIVGERIQSVVVCLNPSLRQIGVKLKPAGLRILAATPAELLTNELYHARDLSLPSLNQLAEQLHALPAPSDAKMLLDGYFMRAFATASTVSVVNQAVGLILQYQGNLRINQLTHQLQVSYKVLEKRFRKEVGVSPKEFCRIIRFKNTYKAFRSGRSADPYFYLDCGYYDQSHFVKEFKYFMNQPPTAYLSGSNLLADTILQNGLSPRLPAAHC